MFDMKCWLIQNTVGVYYDTATHVDLIRFKACQTVFLKNGAYIVLSSLGIYLNVILFYNKKAVCFSSLNARDFEIIILFIQPTPDRCTFNFGQRRIQLANIHYKWASISESTTLVQSCQVRWLALQRF